MELEAIDSPITPATPLSPADITIQRGGEDSEPISFSECQELVKTVKNCSQSIIEGNWVEIPDIRGKTQRFIHDNFESAKAFLRASINGISSRKDRESSLETPVTSHPRHQAAMGVCHQCHGPIGGGAHTGSAFGKGICTLRPEHSHFCKGGILENDSWAACPLGYMYNADLDLAAGPGFEGTMDTFNFQAGIQNGPASSTPAGDQPQSHPGPGGQQQVLHLDSGPYTEPHHDSVNQLIPRLARLQATEERYPGVMNGEQRVLDREFPPTPPENLAHNLQPAVVDGAVGGIPENIQSEIVKHRAVNQNERAVTDRPASDLVITDLRRDPTLQLGVENVMQDVIRNRIPSLSAAPSAQAVPSNPIFTENVFTAGDGIRVAGVSAVNGDLGARSKIYGRQPPIQPNSAQPGSHASDPQPQAHPAYQQGQQQVYTAQPVQTNGQPRFSPVQLSVQQPAGNPTQAMGPAHQSQQQAHHTQPAYQGQQQSYVQPSVHQPGGHPTQAVGSAHQGQPQAPLTQHAFQGQQSSQHAQAVGGFQQGQPQSHSYQQPYSQGPQPNGHPTQGAPQPVNQQYHGGQPSVHHAGGQQTGYVQHSHSTPQLNYAPTHPGPQTSCPPYPPNLPSPSSVEKSPVFIRPCSYIRAFGKNRPYFARIFVICPVFL